MRARITQARTWEQANHSDALFGGKGMGAQRAAWVEAFTVEAAALQQEEQAQALLDLTKAFELVDHSKLVDAAIKRKYPLAILKLSLAAYRLPRSIGIDGNFSREVTATRGITAGSGFATSELRLLLIDLLEDTQAHWGLSVRLSLYVDDLTISVRGKAAFVRNRLAAAVDRAVHIFQDKLLLQVSVKKSMVVASTVKLAKQIARQASSSILTHTRAAKLLGTGTAGGKRRTTIVLKSRLQKVRKYGTKMWALRKTGANTQLMTRTAATPAMMYGADIQGVATSMLRQQTSTIARLAAPEGGGKNPLKTLYAIDGPNGTTDPAFDAHALLVKHWAMAWWDNWVPAAAMKAAHHHIKTKLGDGNAGWNKATGPTAALHLSLKRMDWKWDSPTNFTDDVGNIWCTIKDPPIAISQAMMRSVRRQRVKQIALMHPDLIPDNTDVGKKRGSRSDIIIDFANVLSPIVKGKVHSLTDTPEFERKHAAGLLSACAGGQWPQVRKAAVKKWGITDDRCQLCLEVTGTLEHRRVCRHNVPEKGWSQLPEKAKLAAETIGPKRMCLLQTTGLMTLRLPKLDNKAYDTLYWGVKPPQSMPNDVRWFIDGSQFCPRRRQLSTLGFGIAAISAGGDLLAWGWGTPPKWCDSASAAEAWALCTILRLSQEIPLAVTDCLGLLNSAARGTGYATRPSMNLARIWCDIAHMLDDNITQLVNSKALTWMPAHQSAAMIGQKTKSNGHPTTSLEWRANRLVDGLAKLAAKSSAASAATQRLVNSAEALVRHTAAQLGVATFNANNHRREITNEDGTKNWKIMRDSASLSEIRKPRQLAPLAEIKTAHATVDHEPDKTESSQPLAGTASRKARARAARQLVLLDSRRKQKAATDAIVQVTRLSNLQAACDHVRRRALAQAHLQLECQPKASTDWKFVSGLNGTETNEHGTLTVNNSDESTTSAAGMHVTPASAQCTDGAPLGASVGAAALRKRSLARLTGAVASNWNSFDAKQPAHWRGDRSRPRRGSGSVSTVCADAAVSRLLGGSSAKRACNTGRVAGLAQALGAD